MKEFRKTEDGLFICEECNRTFVTYKNGICQHIYKSHNTKNYYDKWLKEEDEGLCKICGKETEFKGFFWKYKFGCCKEHIDLYAKNCRKETNFKNYGVEYNWQREDVKEKSKQTSIIKYGVKKYNNTQKGKQTKLKNHDDENYCNIIKCKQTKLKKYGNENFNNPEKGKQTCLKHYGVEHPMQNKEIFEKSQKHSFYIQQYKDTNIYYRGSYEFDFIEKYLPIFPDIQNAKAIKYSIKEKIKIYYPDFYIPLLNLIIECKNSYLAKIDQEIIGAKKKATIVNGFNYLMIVDKDYSELK